MKKIPYGKQFIDNNDIQSVVEVLKSDYLTQGRKIKEFEEEISRFVSCKYSCTFNSATSALHVACLSLGVSKGDLVWTSANSFVASSNCALYCGAEIDFLDIDKDTFLISAEIIEKKLIEAKNNKKLPKVIILVHLGGESCEMEKIFELSRQYKFKIIEDASHAFGGSYKSSHIGSCKYSDLCVFSFHPVKIITTGEGGMITTNNFELYQKSKLLGTHGIVKDKSVLINKKESYWYYEQQNLGFNYRMTDIQAALGLSQLKKIKKFILKRRKIALFYEEKFKKNSLIHIQKVRKPYESSFHLFIVKLDDKIAHHHRSIFENLHKLGIIVQLHYMPIYLNPYYKNLGFNKGYCPISENYANTCFSIPLHPSLKEDEISFVADNLNILTKKASDFV